MNPNAVVAAIHARLPRILDTGEGLDADLALAVLALDAAGLFALLPLTDRLRRHFRGGEIVRCAIANVKSGRCPENCAYCAQSAHYDTTVKTFPLRPAADVMLQAAAAREHGAANFSFVTSGTAVDREEEITAIEEMIAGLRRQGIAPCASLGFLTSETAARYRRAGLRHYHHNLETARSFFPSICTTHTYDNAVATVRAAKTVGLYVCSGGIIGMGESRAQRVELAETLRDLEVDSIPLNFLHPIPGTPLAGRPVPGARESLLTVALFRLVCPTRDIRVCGGRPAAFADAQAMIFAAGANGLMIGDYLTTSGRQWADDERLLAVWGDSA
ncbi:MAG: biotin synthase BioB [Deltaproteobacteria bacterium]|nr:biotin synthase BioB [Candidatus Anaeroferrophillacea bacterium]